MPTILPAREESPVPAKLTGKEFESYLMESAVREKDRLTMSRYGTETRFINGEPVTVASMPDFEGIYRDSAKQFIIEAKAVSGSSLPLAADHFRDRQYDHMKRRAGYGAGCFLIIHFNRRQVGKSDKFIDQVTVRIPVHPSLQLWKDYEAETLKSINLEKALEFGTVIEWTIPPGKRKALPAFL